MANTYNSNTGQVEEGRMPLLQGQPGLNCDTLSQNKEIKMLSILCLCFFTYCPFYLKRPCTHSLYDSLFIIQVAPPMTMNQVFPQHQGSSFPHGTIFYLCCTMCNYLNIPSVRIHAWCWPAPSPGRMHLAGILVSPGSYGCYVTRRLHRCKRSL